MTLSIEDKKTLSELRIKKAYEFLDDAKANLDEGRLRTAINRAYYAVLNAARALLILEGSNPETHEGIITMLSLRFIKPGLLPVQLIKNYKRLLSSRTDIDYGDFDTVTTEEAEDAISVAEETIKDMDSLRKRLLDEI
ncbi:MAG TPA: HEPN domain-containing protein [Nitrospirae bacterium]|nr:HEPN domain-containing protein [Nitrospirota bacterium]